MKLEQYEYACIALRENPYKDDAAEALAVIFDVGVNVCECSGQDVADAFVISGLAQQFERQNPVYVAGKSGFELLETLMTHLGGQMPDCAPCRFDRTPDYWLGWVLGLYQSETGKSFKRIFQVIPYAELVGMYYPLHEASETKFFETIEHRLSRSLSPTRLRVQRDAAELSQTELSERSDVGLRSIQMYEQRNKDINRAQAATLIRLARALHCDIEDLLEAG